MNNVSYLEGEALLQSLLRLGIASDPSILRKTLTLIFNTKSLKAHKIFLQDFKSIFKSDQRTNSILTRMNELSIEARGLKSRKLVVHDTELDIHEGKSIFSNRSESPNN